MKKMKDYILEKSNGEVTTVSSIGIKNFATIMDRPERLKMMRSKDGKEYIKLCRTAAEKVMNIKLNNGVDVKVGAYSGVVVEVSSGTTSQIRDAVENQNNKDIILRRFSKQNQRALTNIDASLGIITKLPIK